MDLPKRLHSSILVQQEFQANVKQSRVLFRINFIFFPFKSSAGNLNTEIKTNSLPSKTKYDFSLNINICWTDDGDRTAEIFEKEK